jgi:hypothetical protein
MTAYEEALATARGLLIALAIEVAVVIIAYIARFGWRLL